MSTSAFTILPCPTHGGMALSESTLETHIPKEQTANVCHISQKGPFAGLPAPFQKGNYTSSFPYIACNEGNQQEILNFFHQRSRQEPLTANRIHLGFSVWFNFDLISVTQPKYAIICDIDNHVIDLYQAIAQGLSTCESPEEFVNYFEKFLLSNLENFFNLQQAEDLRHFFKSKEELIRPGSWLSSDRRYQAVKSLQEKGRLLFLNLDITQGKETFIAIQAWMKTHQLVLDTLYVSNINEWLSSSLKQQSYLLNLKTIAMKETHFIHAYKTQQTGGPQLFIEKGFDAIKMPSRRPLKQSRAPSPPLTLNDNPPVP